MSFSTHSKLRDNAGLTIIEVVTAFAVATAGIFGALEVHTRVMDRVRVMHEEDIVLGALANEIEALRAAPFDQLQPGAAQPFISAPDLGLLVEPNALVNIQATSTAGLLQIQPQVTWSGENGRRITRSLSTLRAARGGDS